MNKWIRSSRCDTSACVQVQFVKSTHCVSSDCVEVAFHKSTYSSTNGSCVEVATCDCDNPQEILVRDSKDKQGPVLTFTPAEWTAFILGAKAGEFD